MTGCVGAGDAVQETANDFIYQRRWGMGTPSWRLSMGLGAFTSPESWPPSPGHGDRLWRGLAERSPVPFDLRAGLPRSAVRRSRIWPERSRPQGGLQEHLAGARSELERLLRPRGHAGQSLLHSSRLGRSWRVAGRISAAPLALREVDEALPVELVNAGRRPEPQGSAAVLLDAWDAARS